VLLVFDAFWGVPNFLESAIRAKKFGCKLVFLVNDIFPITHPEFTERNNKELFNQKIFDSLDLADGLLYPSNVTKDAIIANILPGGITIPNQRVLYGASSDNETSWFYEQVERIPGSILMLGTIEPRKNHRLVLKWFLSKAPENTTLTIIGADGWENEEVKSILRRESMKKPGLSWLKEASDEDVAYEMMRHEIGLFASHGEGLGLPVIEYSAAGLKLVLSDIPVFREVAGDSGLYFDQNSVESLDDAISRATAQEKVLSIPARSWNETAIEVLVFCRKYFD
jgi:alpha-1,2-rhamnosyltransferase